MANKRTLKHSINLVCGDLFAECVAARLYGNRGDDCEIIKRLTVENYDEEILQLVVV